jgi:protein TonB
MAPQAKLEEIVPTTLPDDFDEWDSGEQPPPTLPDDFDEFDAVPAGPVKSAPTPVAVVPMVANRTAEIPIYRAPAALPPRPAPALVPAATPVLKRTQELPVLRAASAATKATIATPVVSRVAEPPASQAPSSKYATTEELSSLVRAYHTAYDAEPEETGLGKKKIMLISIGAGVLVLAVLLVMYFTMFRKSPEKKPVVVVQQPTVSYTPDEPALQQGKPNPSTLVQATPDTGAPAAQVPAVRSEMMNTQLNAPARISKDVKGQERDGAPPPASFATGGLEGLGGTSAGAVGSVFGKQAAPKVRIETPRIVTISSGVAQGMLTLKTTPVYPPIAKTARVSGTVVLQATISKSGQIENLRVVSGPQMLRQSAADAVRAWRYKPYMLNNEPVEVETTVSVVFSLGG